MFICHSYGIPFMVKCLCTFLSVLKTELLSCWLLKFFIYTFYNIINTFIIKTAYCLTLLVDIWFLKDTTKVSQNLIWKVQTNFQTWDTKETLGKDTL